jgi:FlaG/FlaF family flagellin (archaellin)
MTVSKTSMMVLAGALLSCVGGSIALAQQPTGQAAGNWGQAGTTYALHSNAASGCPALDWHLVVQNDGTIGGMVGVNDMKTMFRVHGTYSGANFQLQGQEVGGKRTAAVNGQLQDQNIALSIGGLPVGSACQGKTVYIKRREAAPVGGEGG